MRDSQSYIDLYRMTKDRRMIQPTIDQVDSMRKLLPGTEAKAHGITWWWCDALFMGPPTLAKLAAELGWRPEHNLDAGLAETVQWYLDHRTWWERVLSEAYRASNILYLKSG